MKQDDQEHIVRCDDRYRRLINREVIARLIADERMDHDFQWEFLDQWDWEHLKDYPRIRDGLMVVADRIIAHIEEVLFD